MTQMFSIENVSVAYGKVEAVFHEGACSDTMETDGKYMMDNNYRYSLDLLEWCEAREIPFIYASSASVYGGGRVFKESREHEAPLNVYARVPFCPSVKARLMEPTVSTAIPVHGCALKAG